MTLPGSVSRTPPLAAIALLGFTSGVPLMLVGAILQAWLKSAGVGLDVIGVFALAGLPYTVKFLWSPLLDRFRPPFGGRRRGWILVLLLAMMGVLGLLAQCDPAARLGPVAALACLVAFLSASADINIDAFRAESLPLRWVGVGTTLHFTAFRVGMLTAGALALWLSDRLSWRAVYLAMALTLVPGALAAMLAPDPPAAPPPPTLREAVVAPFASFFRRPRALEVLAFALLFKLGDTLATSLNVPFLMEMGFSRSEIGLATNNVGLGALLAGGLLGGWAMHRLRLSQSLWGFGLLQLAALLTYALLAGLGRSQALLVAVIGLENAVFSIGTVALLATIQRACDPERMATQFAFLTSLMAIARVLLGTMAGVLAKNLGWRGFFLVCALAALPGLFLLRGYRHWELSGGDEPGGG